MDDLSRSEYPAMLANLQPSQSVQTLSDRVKRINKINLEIADWLQERRKVEDQYVNNLRRLLIFKVPNVTSELGVFQAPWDKILQSTDAIAASHQLFASRVEKDVEQALRTFQNKREMQNIQNISTNLNTMAKELEDAQEKSEKLGKKGGKANAQKVDLAASRLESATQQWESQAPFIFETLQALDEQRINHLRDVLTQLLTHEVDQATRSQAAAEEALNTMLEINTSQEIQNFAQRTTAGKPKVERRAPSSFSRQSSAVPGSSLAAPSVSGHDDDISEHSGHRDHSESKLRSRIGTMLGRRRQSVHGGFGPISPQKSLGPFTRNIASSHGRTISPRASSHNLTDSHSQNRLSSLAERPTSDDHADAGAHPEKHEGTNGVGTDSAKDPAPSSSAILNGSPEDIFDAPPPPGPPPSHQQNEEVSKDADGFTIPAASHDPISEAMKEAHQEEADQFFKLKIQNEPITEEDQDAKQAALSNVANTLQMGMPSRKTGTVRGRRDVRNTIYMPNLAVPDMPTSHLPPSPSLPASLATMTSKSTAATTLASETSHASDTQSIHSGTSLGGASIGSIARVKHPDLHGPGYGPGLHASIIETVSATFEGGVVKSAKINGEIAFAYNSDPESSNPDHETIRLNQFPNLSAIGPNRVFVSYMPSSPDEFTLDLSHLNVTSPAFTYRVHAEDDSPALSSHCPIKLEPAWKPGGDKLGLLLQYQLNPSCTLPRPVILSNVVFVASYEGGRASGVQTKPSGTHLKDKHIVYWRLGDITLTETGGKIICRVIGEQNAEPLPGKIDVRWEYATTPGSEKETLGSRISVSRLTEGKGKGKAQDEDEEDPFADEEGPASPPVNDGRTWADIPLVTKLISGKYEAK